MKYFLLILFSAFFYAVPILAAECGGTGQSPCPAEVHNGTSQKDTTLNLREPLIPGKKTIDVSVKQGSLGIIAQYSKMIYTYMLALGSIIGVISLMFAGLKMIVSAGDSKAVGEAKTIILGSLKSLAILYLAGLILYVINPNFFTFSGGSM